MRLDASLEDFQQHATYDQVRQLGTERARALVDQLLTSDPTRARRIYTTGRYTQQGSVYERAEWDLGIPAIAAIHGIDADTLIMIVDTVRSAEDMPPQVRAFDLVAAVSDAEQTRLSHRSVGLPVSVNSGRIGAKVATVGRTGFGKTVPVTAVLDMMPEAGVSLPIAEDEDAVELRSRMDEFVAQLEQPAVLAA